MGGNSEEVHEMKERGRLTDGTERPIRRPKDAVQQKERYSGKKKRHTSKHVTITHPKTQRILAVSEEAPGTKHDKKIMDEAQLSCTTNLAMRADSGHASNPVDSLDVWSFPTKRQKKRSLER